jgi:hypothetical protein
MEIRPALNFSSRLSLREFEGEMWKLYFGVVKGLLLAITSVVYLFVLTAFFIVQHGMLIACKIKESVVDWNPEKPEAFGVRAVNGSKNTAAHGRLSNLKTSRMPLRKNCDARVTQNLPTLSKLTSLTVDGD